MRSQRSSRRAGWIARLVAVLTLCATVVSAAPGEVVITPPTPPGFRFELEVAPGSLKDIPIWDELEQMLDNPYAVALAPGVEGNVTGGYPS